MSLLSWDATYEIHFWVSRELLEQHHAYWRLFTALAAHADWQHLLANAPLFIIFGWLLRSYFGWWFFPVLPVLAGAGANYLTLQWYEPWQRLLGCSGMVYAMVGMWLVLYIRYETRFSLPMRFFRCMGFSFIILMPTTLHPTTSYLAHAFGFLLGLVCALVFA
jgi:rhomboid protease GluP